MLRLIFLAASALVILASPAAARCNQPYAPVVKISPSATKEDITTLHDDVTSFIKASDIYQSCLVSQDANDALVDENQAEKQKVGRQYDAAVRAFKTSHPQYSQRD